MHSLLSRVNAVSAFCLSTLAGLTFLCFLSTVFKDYSGAVKVEATNLIVKNVPEYVASKENDLGAFRFSISSDTSPLFNWNVKQIFLYLTAEYETTNNKVNQVVVWDKIIRRGEQTVIQIKNEHMKYYFWDDGNGLLGHKNITLSLSWNIIPNAGTLPLWMGTGSYQIAFPTEYTQGKNY